MGKFVSLIVSGCGVTANILVLGTSDSGFESLHPDKNPKSFLDFIKKK